MPLDHKQTMHITSSGIKKEHGLSSGNKLQFLSTYAIAVGMYINGHFQR